MKRILLRLDLNVPLKGNRITDDYKLRRSLPTLRLFRRRKDAVIIMTHLGESTRVDVLAGWLSRQLGFKIPVLRGEWKEIKAATKELQAGKIVLLDNLRLFPGEKKNDSALAKRLAALGDIYVNDAFAVSHRNHASVSAIKRFLPSYRGPLLSEELAQLDRAKQGRDCVVIIGGAKISTKEPLIKAFSKRATVLTGGNVANALLKEKAEGKKISPRIKLPIDLAFHRGKAYDIGPATIATYTAEIKKARTIIWNGPLGVFEVPGFEKGTHAIARAVKAATRQGAFSLIGGGETVAALGSARGFSWVSTGGGATLSYLSGQTMPGLRNLRKL